MFIVYSYFGGCIILQTSCTQLQLVLSRISYSYNASKFCVYVYNRCIIYSNSSKTIRITIIMQRNLTDYSFTVSSYKLDA